MRPWVELRMPDALRNSTNQPAGVPTGIRIEVTFASTRTPLVP